MKLKITIDDRTYEVEVEAEEPDAAAPSTPARPPRSAPAAPSPAAAPSQPASPPTADPVVSDRVCRSPIVGTIVEILAQPGQQVQVDDPLAVLEAMKMETSVTSPLSGVIKRVLAQPGDSVQAGQILVEFE